MPYHRRASPGFPGHAAPEVGGVARSRVEHRRRRGPRAAAPRSSDITDSLVQVPGNELPKAFRLRRAEHMFGRTFFFDQSVVQKHHAIRDFAGKAHLVGHHDHRRPVRCEFAHDAQDFIGKLGIQRRCRFIEQHHLGLHGQGARDRHALLLSSR